MGSTTTRSWSWLIWHPFDVLTDDFYRDLGGCRWLAYRMSCSVAEADAVVVAGAVAVAVAPG